MILCSKCKPPFKTLMGDGKCPKHGRFSFYSKLKEPCPACANENQICQVCGNSLDVKYDENI